MSFGLPLRVSSSLKLLNCEAEIYTLKCIQLLKTVHTTAYMALITAFCKPSFCTHLISCSAHYLDEEVI